MEVEVEVSPLSHSNCPDERLVWSVVCGLTVLIFKPLLYAVTLDWEANTANIKLRPTYRRLGNGEYRIEVTSSIINRRNMLLSYYIPRKSNKTLFSN